MRIHGFLYDARDCRKAELPVEKVLDRDFIGRI